MSNTNASLQRIVCIITIFSDYIFVISTSSIMCTLSLYTFEHWSCLLHFMGTISDPWQLSSFITNALTIKIIITNLYPILFGVWQFEFPIQSTDFFISRLVVYKVFDDTKMHYIKFKGFLVFHSKTHYYKHFKSSQFPFCPWNIILFDVLTCRSLLLKKYYWMM